MKVGLTLLLGSTPCAKTQRASIQGFYSQMLPVFVNCPLCHVQSYLPSTETSAEKSSKAPTVTDISFLTSDSAYTQENLPHKSLHWQTEPRGIEMPAATELFGHGGNIDLALRAQRTLHRPVRVQVPDQRKAPALRRQSLTQLGREKTVRVDREA